MKVIRRTLQVQPLDEVAKPSEKPLYAFYEKSTGTVHFQVEAGPNGELPLDHAAGLLAMHCMVRGNSPADYLVMVPAAPQDTLGLAEKAQRLLQAGHSVKSAVRLTRREEEVMDGIRRSLANKEIANELNLSERTVKFHVSSLLAKFKVRSRMELVRNAAQALTAPVPTPPMPQPEALQPRAATAFRRVPNHGKVLPLNQSRWMA